MNHLSEGKYLNFRNEVVTLVRNQDGLLEQEGSQGLIVYQGNTCMCWDGLHAEYVMHSDPQQDIKHQIGSHLFH